MFAQDARSARRARRADVAVLVAQLDAPIVCFDSPPAYRWAENGQAIAEVATKRAAEDKKMTGGTSPLDTIRGIASNARVSSARMRKAAAQYQPRVEYPRSDLGQDLRTAAALLSSGIGVRVMSVAHYGYDTHEDQRRRHDILMAELDGGLSAFSEGRARHGGRRQRARARLLGVRTPRGRTMPRTARPRHGRADVPGRHAGQGRPVRQAPLRCRTWSRAI
jgi:uncharacterized protein (DUF1501 family)